MYLPCLLVSVQGFIAVSDLLCSVHEFSSVYTVLLSFQSLYFVVSLSRRAAVGLEQSDQCEISGFLIVEHSDNTNFRCPSISEARLSVAESSLDTLRAAIFHSWRHRSSSGYTMAR